MPDKSDTSEERERQEQRERARLYNLGAMAQSYVPRDVAELLNLSDEGRMRAREEWRARPRRERALLYGLLVVELLCFGVLIGGVASGRVVLVLAGAAAFVVLLLGTAFVTAVSEQRRAKDHRPVRRTPRRPPS